MIRDARTERVTFAPTVRPQAPCRHPGTFSTKVQADNRSPLAGTNHTVFARLTLLACHKHVAAHVDQAHFGRIRRELVRTNRPVRGRPLARTRFEDRSRVDSLWRHPLISAHKHVLNATVAPHWAITRRRIASRPDPAQPFPTYSPNIESNGQIHDGMNCVGGSRGGGSIPL